VAQKKFDIFLYKMALTALYLIYE